MTIRRLITLVSVTLAVSIASAWAFASPPRPPKNCTVVINGQEVRITGSDGDWHVYCEKLGIESSGTSICVPLQEVIDALP